MLKIIYLSIHFSHVGLDVTLEYSKINTILLFQKQFSTFFPLWNCTLGFFERKKSYNLLFFSLSIIYLLIFLVLLLFLDTFLGVFDCMVEKIGFAKVCLKLKE